MASSEGAEHPVTIVAPWVAQAAHPRNDPRTAVRSPSPHAVATRARSQRNLTLMEEKKPGVSARLSTRGSGGDVVGASDCAWQCGQVTRWPARFSGTLRVLSHRVQRKRIMSNAFRAMQGRIRRRGRGLRDEARGHRPGRDVVRKHEVRWATAILTPVTPVASLWRRKISDW